MNVSRINSLKPFVSDAIILRSGKQLMESSGLNRIFIIECEPGEKNTLIKMLKFHQYIEYVQEIGTLKLESISDNYFIPDDPYLSNQYYLNSTGFNEIWDLTLGDSSVAIGVIDSGLDFTHPDLQNSYKINQGEYGNGKESNGTDDDNNGYIDDWRGWNFILNNNDPADDNIYSHGSAVTGIINAGFNNGIGISSASPKIKVLVLKAFDVNGTGAEDIVSYAVLYGITQGVKIFNFSFGDVIYSNLFQDIVKYAYSKNITIVTSAGNTSSDAPHYPASFDEVISAGATDANDFRTGFSAFGETVDIFAPGNQILTTSRTGKGLEQFNYDYFYVNGTSFSAPLISSAAALLLSRNPNLSNEEIRGILVSGTVFIKNQTKWDHYSASGKLNVKNSLLNINVPAVTRIYSPFQNFSSYENSVPLVISSVYPYTRITYVYYSIGENFVNPVKIFSTTNQHINDTVLNWNIQSMPDTTYTLRLIAETFSGRTIEHGLIFYKDSKSPEILGTPEGIDITDSNSSSRLISFYTNKPTIGKIYYKRYNFQEPYRFIFADLGYENIGYVSNIHFGFLKGKNLFQNTEYEYYIEATALNKKTVTYGNSSFKFTPDGEYNENEYITTQYALPPGQFCDTLIDLNGNGLKEILLNETNINLKLNLYEFNGQGFNKISNDNWEELIIAKDIQDIRGNGKPALLTSRGRNGILYESGAPGELPLTKIWSDEGKDDFWSSKIYDTDSDGKKEIMGYGRTGFRILEYSGGQFTQIANLPYSNISAEPNSQKILIDDFDLDGKKEIIYADLCSSNNLPVSTLNIYKCVSDNYYTPVNRISIEGVSYRAECLTTGDFNGNGKPEIVFGTTSDEDLLNIYYISVFELNSNGTEILLDRISIRNYSPLSNTSLTSYSITGNTNNLLSINAGNLFYIYFYNGVKFIPLYFRGGINSYSQGVFNLNNNGINEIAVNFLGDSLRFIEKKTLLSQTQSPTGVKGYSIDSNSVFLNFNIVEGAQYYKIYRSIDSINFLVYDTIFNTSFFDNNVNNKQYYYYKITATDTTKTIIESNPAEKIRVFVHNKIRLLSGKTESDKSISVKFSGNISYSSPNPSSFLINDSFHPDFISYKTINEYLLTFKNKLNNGIYKIKANNLFDAFNSPVDSNEIFLNINIQDSVLFYITNAKLISKNQIKVTFNIPVDSLTSTNENNYLFEPFNLKISKSEFDNQNRNCVVLTISGGTPGASGRYYLLKVINIKSESGVPISTGAGSSYGFAFVSETLENVIVYPNPLTKTVNRSFITFANLTPSAKIFIFDLSGNFIREIIETDGNGGVEWDLKDFNGKETGSGIYIFRVTGKNSEGADVEEKIGKFAIIK